MKHGLPHGIIAACIAGLCACTPAPTAAPTQTVPAAAPIAGPATTPAVAPVTAAADATPPADEATPAAAEAVVRAYYAAINARDFAEAYAQWGDDGAASGQSLENFRNGYAGTRSIEATVGAATAAEDERDHSPPSSLHNRAGLSAILRPRSRTRRRQRPSAEVGLAASRGSA